MFAHHVIVNNKPELLQGMPGFAANGEANGAGEGKEVRYPAVPGSNPDCRASYCRRACPNYAHDTVLVF